MFLKRIRVGALRVMFLVCVCQPTALNLSEPVKDACSLFSLWILIATQFPFDQLKEANDSIDSSVSMFVNFDVKKTKLLQMHIQCRGYIFVPGGQRNQ